jgi:hypothetical protein
VIGARARGGAVRALDDALDAFARAGYRDAERTGPLEARLQAGPLPLRLHLEPAGGRIFGGTLALEITTAEAVLPATRGISIRGRGVVRMSGVVCRTRRRDPAGAELARRLESDQPVADAIRAVHFERIRVEPDGRATIRHMGGSVVWMLFPPVVRPIPFVEGQARATVDALRTIARRIGHG